MTRYDRRVQALAGVLAGLAGYVDASGFGATGGFFVSFMSGNSTRLGVGLVRGGASAALAGGLIGCFVAGVMGGALVARSAGRRRASVVLAGVAVLLAGSAALGGVGRPVWAACFLSVGMGGMNNVFERDGQVSIPLTYMTGSLVKFGQLAAASLVGGERFGWVPYLMLWAGFLVGVLCGAGMYARFGLGDLWGAVGVAGLLAILVVGVEEK